MRLIIGFLLAIVPATLCQLVAEKTPRPTVSQFTVIRGTCDEGRGTISGAVFTGRLGTLKACSTACLATASCVGFNFLAESNRCQLFSAECGNTDNVSPTGPIQNYYTRGEISCAKSTQGNEYYAAFMSNRVAQPAYPDLELWVSQDSDPLNKVYVKVEGDNTDLQLGANYSKVEIPYKEAKKIPLLYSWKMKDGDWLANVETKAVRLSSDTDFVFYGVNKEFFTTDAFLGIPSLSLGRRYIVACHWPPNYNCEFAVTPTEDDAIIKVTLPKQAATKNVGDWPKSGNGVPQGNETCRVTFGGRTYTNGDTFTVELDEFEVLQVQDPCDLTGTIIESDTRIAVWSGNSRVNVGTSESRDHLVEQLFPTDNWGFDCAAWPTPRRQDGLVDYWLITAAEDGTRIQVDSSEQPVRVVSLNAAESFRYPAKSVREWQRISANKPIQVIQTAASATDNSYPGDPSTTVCIPSFQFGYGYTFVTPSGVATTYTNYLTIVATKGTQNGFRLNNNTVTGVTWNDIPNSQLVGGYVPLDRNTAQFRIEHQTRGTAFEAYIYGSGDRESYAYPTGACIKTVGECKTSTMVLADGKDNDCDGVVDEELLDGIDNDFDGKIDEDCFAKKACDCCTQILCPDIPKIDGGYAVAFSTKPGSRVTYNCLDGKSLVGNAAISCNADGTWSGTAPRCV